MGKRIDFTRPISILTHIRRIRESMIKSCLNNNISWFYNSDENMRKCFYENKDWDSSELGDIRRRLLRRKGFKNCMKYTNWLKMFDRAHSSVDKYIKRQFSDIRISDLIEGYVISNSKLMYQIIISLINNEIRNN